MGKLFITIGIFVFGWLGWWIGSRFGFTTAYFLSFAEVSFSRIFVRAPALGIWKSHP